LTLYDEKKLEGIEIIKKLELPFVSEETSAKFHLPMGRGN
jgi:hypothetical protein